MEDNKDAGGYGYDDVYSYCYSANESSISDNIKDITNPYEEPPDDEDEPVVYSDLKEDEQPPLEDVHEEEPDEQEEQSLALPNPILFAKQTYSREMVQMMKFRDGPIVPSWKTGKHSNNDSINFLDGSKGSQFTLSSDFVGFAQLDVSVSGGSWYFECGVSLQHLKHVSVGWMLTDSLKKVGDDAFSLEGIAVGGLDCFSFVKRVIGSEDDSTSHDRTIIGLFLDYPKLQIFEDNNEVLSEEFKLDSQKLSPFVISTDQAAVCSMRIQKIHWQYSRGGNSLEPIQMRCAISHFWKLSRMLSAKSRPSNTLKRSTQFNTLQLQVFQVCYSVQHQELLTALRDQCSAKVDLEYFRFILHSFLAEFIISRDSTSKGVSRSKCPQELFRNASLLLHLANRSSKFTDAEISEFAAELWARVRSAQAPSMIEEFVCAIRMPIGFEKESRIVKAFAEFFSIAEFGVETIINELHSTSKTLSPVDIGGVAGGEKFKFK
jgi:hypothetical protein